MTDSSTGRPAEDDPERTAAIPTDEPGRDAAAAGTAPAPGEATAADTAPGARAAETAPAPTAVQPTVQQPSVTPAPAPTVAQPVIPAADEQLPPPPKRESNRLVGTLWVLLAAGLFQVVYFGAIALLVLLLFGGPSAVGPQLAAIPTPFGWLPVLLFFLLFELTVLVFNRAGRFLYVVASLVVGLVVWLLSVLLATVISRGSFGDAATFAQGALYPLFVLSGLTAREVMLWTGVAIGARGSRVRRRNRARRDAYRSELEERRNAAV